MKLRCPYCRQVFEKIREASCPHCGKGVRLHPSIDEAKAAGRRRAMRLRKTAARDRPRPTLWHIPLLVFTYRSRIFVWALVLGTVIAGRLLFTRVHPAEAMGPSRAERTRRELRVLRTALEWFRADCKRYPTDAEGLKALVRNPGLPRWKGHYIDGLPPDLWGRPFQYACTNGTPRLFSMGPDGMPGTADDVASPAPDYKALVERVRIDDLPRWPTNRTSEPPDARTTE